MSETQDDRRGLPAALDAFFAEVEAEPWAHDFFALLRRVDALMPDAPRFGRGLRPLHEALRLGQEAELDFAPAAVAVFERHSGGGAPRLGVRFFGLLGPQGPMPLHLTEYIRERSHQRGDATWARFVDVFHHRMLSLFYRAWAQSQPVVQRDRPDDDRYAAWLGAAAGLDGAKGLQGAVPIDAKLYRAGLLASRSRHPEGLEKLLASDFGVPVRIACHVGHWLAIQPEDQSRLGHARNRPERAALPAAQLGAANAGRKVWDRQYKFRIELGPLSLAVYLRFLPDGTAWKRLHDWVRLYVGLDLTWDVALCLRAEQVPPARLGRQVRLGLTSWLGRSTGNRRDLRLRPAATSSLLRKLGAEHG